MMKLKTLRCPNCGAKIDNVDGFDTYYCSFCGYQVVAEGMSRASYSAKTRVKELEVAENIYDKDLAQERYKMQFERDNERHFWKWYLIVMLVLFGALWFMGWHETKEKEEKIEELQEMVDEVMDYIEEGNFKKAYAKAEQIKWEGSILNSETRKWNNTRKRLIKEIEKAEKASKKK